ncbi:endolytic transglycosylase MltG [Streptomyces sp. NBC_00063]|uniref:endolytic transglycosylase MltG n=1 Tax=Streptomyces sp. NBC_00063 TaxID=2975638 RepID=UPI0022527A87|nr:endolytic transglycosylase MltG [Streptomyces sp. NBC_00063]MCX5435775.1 endolytic transglycosylase MltG [Streptomyces sp. NBC_00063]
MLNEIPQRGMMRLTRRGRASLIAMGALVAAAAAVVVPLLLPDDGGTKVPPALTVPEGWRASQVYEALDKALGVPAGTTKKAVPGAGLKLPTDAEGNPEGYLFPETYPLNDKSTPAGLLSYMVNTANRKLNGSQVTAGADRDAVSPYQTLTIASIVEAEAATKEDMGKVARVIYNRLDRGMPLQMDSTINYGLNRSTLDTTTKDTRAENPYNTYVRMGLPPTPIANPGAEAMKAAISPPRGDWLYFVTVKPGDTRFTADFDEQQKNVEEFNKLRASDKPSSA